MVVVLTETIGDCVIGDKIVEHFIKVVLLVINTDYTKMVAGIFYILYVAQKGGTPAEESAKYLFK